MKSMAQYETLKKSTEGKVRGKGQMGGVASVIDSGIGYQ